MRKYTPVDNANGEEIEADADTVKRVTGVEISYIDWVLEQDGKFENRDWAVRASKRSWRPDWNRGPLRKVELGPME